MTSYSGRLKDFHIALDDNLPAFPVDLNDNDWTLRNTLIQEEWEEFLTEWFQPSPWDEEQICRIAKEMADLIYVLVGTAVKMGVDIDNVFEEVHRSNMTKFPMIKREDGKLLKGPNYIPPNVADHLEWR